MECLLFAGGLMVSEQRRQIAYKVSVSDILGSRYVKNEGWQPNMVVIGGLEVSRVNIIATVVTDPVQEYNSASMILDDGTGKISVRSFDGLQIVKGVGIGMVVLVIARPREYNNEKYLIPEIVKPIQDPRWIDVRIKELDISPMHNALEEAKLPLSKVVENAANVASRAFGLVKKLDSGGGALFEEIVKELNSPDAESVIEKLLKDGEIFEIRPGWLKVLD
jgi:RPA family protein